MTQLPHTQTHTHTHTQTHTHTPLGREPLPSEELLDSGQHAIKTLCWERRRLCVLGWGCRSSCSSSRIRARPTPFCSLPQGRKVRRGQGWRAGVGAPAGPAPTLGYCLWQAAQSPESHSDPQPWSGPVPRTPRGSAPRSGAMLTQTEAWLWPQAPRSPCASGLAFFLAE